MSRNSWANDYGGGIVGYAISTNLENCSFSGKILYSAEEPLLYAHLGGLISFYHLSAKDNIFISNCRVKGNIESISNHDSLYVGGVIGFSQSEIIVDELFNYFEGSLTISNTFYEEGNIRAEGSGDVFAGGFIGYINNGNYTINNSGSFAGSVIIDSTQGAVYAGGFTSTFIGSISNSFARTDVIIRGNNDIFAGGFLGRLWNYGSELSKLSNCYATGSVRAVSNYAGSDNFGTDFTVGGLIGWNIGGLINNSYATGNVFADRTIGTGSSYVDLHHFGVEAGALVGLISAGEIYNSFSTGQVIAQSAESIVSAGGLIGYSFGLYTIKNSAALGSRIIAGSVRPFTGRIAGYKTSSDILTNNHAINLMWTGTGPRITDVDFFEDDFDVILSAFDNAIAYSVFTGSQSPAPVGHNTINGVDVDVFTIRESPFWLRAPNTGLGFNLGGSGVGGLANTWEFLGIEGRGYPLLIGLLGQ